MSTIKEHHEVPTYIHSKKIMTSYSAGEFVYEFTQGILVFILFYFYEVEVGLGAWLTGIALMIYSLWDAINDPLIGYLCDRPRGFTKKWGRRFPWMIIGYIPMLIFFLLIFSPPNIDAQTQPWTIFIWLVVVLCLFDTFETLFTSNFFALFPDKFRGDDERVKASWIYVYLGLIGVVLANLLPPIIIIYGNLGSFALMAWIAIIISLASGVVMIPGIKDDKKSVEEYLSKYDKIEKESFITSLKAAIKHKSLIGFLFLFLAWINLSSMVQSSFLYVVRFVLLGETGDVLILMVMFLLGVIIGIPIWFKYYKKVEDNRKTMIYTSIACVIMTALLSFMTTLISLLIVIFIWGIALGGFWVIYIPTFSDVIDESIATTGIRREGFYSGIRRFFSNFSRVILSLLFALVHDLTGFVETSDIQTPLANMGILLLFGVVPASIMVLGLIIFWRLYEITPDRAKSIKEKLAELKI